MLLLLACAPADSAEPAPEPVGHVVLRGATVVGVGVADVEIDGDRIVAVGRVGEAEVVDVTGKWLVPGFVDSHVHLAYLPEADALAAGGVVAAVDLAAPIEFVASDAPLRIAWSGPMVTAPSGYPTTSWGRDGYGIECADADEAVAAVERIHAAGGRVVKIPLEGTRRLDAAAVAAAVARAHALGMKVAMHALSDADALAAAQYGADALAHTPSAAMPATTAAWSGRAVVSTLSAFPGNLGAFRDAGATVLYGTDFGNTREPGISAAEIAALVDAGLSPAEVIAAGTSAPAAFWGFDDLGEIAAGKAASLLVLGADPLVDPLALASPEAVYVDGVRFR
ncbi:MAG: amidohydrolase family protein [Myxococcota bacterium]